MLYAIDATKQRNTPTDEIDAIVTISLKLTKYES